jgi:hypothetical protein
MVVWCRSFDQTAEVGVLMKKRRAAFAGTPFFFARTE